MDIKNYMRSVDFLLLKNLRCQIVKGVNLWTDLDLSCGKERLKVTRGSVYVPQVTHTLKSKEQRDNKLGINGVLRFPILHCQTVCRMKGIMSYLQL